MAQVALLVSLSGLSLDMIRQSAVAIVFARLLSTRQNSVELSQKET